MYGKKERSLFRKGFAGKDRLKEEEENSEEMEAPMERWSDEKIAAEKRRRETERNIQGLDFEDGGVVKKPSYFSKLKKMCKRK